MTDGIDALVSELSKHAASADRNSSFPEESLGALRRCGLLGLLVPRGYGGMGASLDRFVALAERLAGGCLSTAMIWAMHCQQVDVLVRHAPASLAERVLPKIARGEVYLASVTTDRVTGGALQRATEPIEESAGKLVFSRDAPIVTGGAYADGFLITLKSAATSGEHQVSLVYADRVDLTVTETGTWNALGMRGTHSVGLHLEGNVDPGNIVGTAGRFEAIARDSMVPMAHIGWSACWLGAARTRFSELVSWLREPGRRGGPDVRSELVRERLTRTRLDLELAHSYLIRCVDELNAVRSNRVVASQVTQIHLNVLKLAVSELSFRAVDRMIEVAGLSKGYLSDSPIPLERAFRDLRSASLNYSNERLSTETGALILTDTDVKLL